MRNYVQAGDSLTLTAPSGGVVSGMGYVIGDLFVVAAVTVAEGLPFAGKRHGVFEFDAETHASTQELDIGDVAYWDETPGRVTKTAAGNTPIGLIVEAKESTADTAKVVLVPRLGSVSDEIEQQASIADIALGSVAGVDGTGSNAASKADVDARMTTLNNKINAIIAALEGAGVIAS